MIVGESWLTVRRIQFATIFLAIKGIQQVVTAAHAAQRDTTFHDLLTNAIFRDVVIPLSATIGSYIVASIIHVRGLSFEGPGSAIIAVPH